MSEVVLVALITGTCTLGAASITGLIAYRISVKKRKSQRMEVKYRRALADLQAFNNLETAYGKALSFALSDTSPHAVKLKVRQDVRNEGLDTPSDLAGEQRVVRAMKALDDIDGN